MIGSNCRICRQSWRIIAVSCVYAVVLVVLLTTLASAQAEVYLPALSAQAGQAAPDVGRVSAAANDRYLVREGANIANASFMEEGACDYGLTMVNLQLSDYWSGPVPGQGTNSASVVLSIDEYPCEGNIKTIWAMTQLADEDFWLFRGGLQSAALDADVDIEICEYVRSSEWIPPTCYPGSAEVHLNWKGIAQPNKNRTQFINNYGRCMSTNIIRGTLRDAEVTGSIIVDGTNYVLGTDPSIPSHSLWTGTTINRMGCEPPSPFFE